MIQGIVTHHPNTRDSTPNKWPMLIYLSRSLLMETKEICTRIYWAFNNNCRNNLVDKCRLSRLRFSLIAPTVSSSMSQRGALRMASRSSRLITLSHRGNHLKTVRITRRPLLMKRQLHLVTTPTIIGYLVSLRLILLLMGKSKWSSLKESRRGLEELLLATTIGMLMLHLQAFNIQTLTRVESTNLHKMQQLLWKALQQEYRPHISLEEAILLMRLSSRETMCFVYHVAAQLRELLKKLSTTPYQT